MAANASNILWAELNRIQAVSFMSLAHVSTETRKLARMNLICSEITHQFSERAATTTIISSLKAGSRMDFFKRKNVEKLS